MKIAYAGLALIFCLSAVLARAEDKGAVTYGGGNGSSFKTAIAILGAKDETEGTKAEYSYLAKHFPNYKLTQQALLHDDKKDYDLLEFTAANGSNHTLYFDITDFFGR